MRRRRLVTTAAALALAGGAITVGATSASAGGPLTCHSSTGYDVHITSLTYGTTRHELVWGGTTYRWQYGYVWDTSLHTVTGHTDAKSTTVLSDYVVIAADAYCGTSKK